jgi:arylsulfatase A-like enzyme
MDLTPTILHYLRLDYQGMDGISLLPALKSNSLERENLYIQRKNGMASDLPEYPNYALRTNTWKYIQDNYSVNRLYNLGQDPGETVNLDEDYPNQSLSMDGLLEDWKRQFNPVEKQQLSSATEDALRSLGYLQ